MKSFDKYTPDARLSSLGYRKGVHQIPGNANHELASELPTASAQQPRDASGRVGCAHTPQPHVASYAANRRGFLDMTGRINLLLTLPPDILTSCFIAATTRGFATIATSLRILTGSAGSSARSASCGARCYNTQVREEGPLWDAKKKVMSRPEDHQSTAAGRKAPSVPKPSSRCVHCLSG
jgi:hypothetical protein